MPQWCHYQAVRGTIGTVAVGVALAGCTGQTEPLRPGQPTTSDAGTVASGMTSPAAGSKGNGVPPVPDASELVDSGQVDDGTVDTDATLDAGSEDAGSTMGSCSFATDCTGTGQATPFCSATGEAAWSCIDGHCLWECGGGGRTCTTDFGASCVTCIEPAGMACENSMCPIPIQTAVVESATCPYFPGTTRPFEGTRLTIVRTGTECRFEAYVAAGSDVLGDWVQLDDFSFLGSFTELGICTGTMLPTGALRMAFNCPSCQFVLMF